MLNTNQVIAGNSSNQVILDDKFSYENVRSSWVPEARHNAPTKPIILVGTKCDSREGCDSVSLISKDTAEKLRKEISAHLYIECSAKTRINTDLVFINAIKVLRNEIGEPRRSARRKICEIL